MLKDAESSAELKKARHPVTGEDDEKIINEAFKIDAALADKWKD